MICLEYGLNWKKKSNLNWESKLNWCLKEIKMKLIHISNIINNLNGIWKLILLFQIKANFCIICYNMTDKLYYMSNSLFLCFFFGTYWTTPQWWLFWFWLIKIINWGMIFAHLYNPLASDGYSTFYIPLSLSLELSLVHIAYTTAIANPSPQGCSARPHYRCPHPRRYEVSCGHREISLDLPAPP